MPKVIGESEALVARSGCAAIEATDIRQAVFLSPCSIEELCDNAPGRDPYGRRRDQTFTNRFRIRAVSSDSCLIFVDRRFAFYTAAAVAALVS